MVNCAVDFNILLFFDHVSDFHHSDIISSSVRASPSTFCNGPQPSGPHISYIQINFGFDRCDLHRYIYFTHSYQLQTWGTSLQLVWQGLVTATTKN